MYMVRTPSLFEGVYVALCSLADLCFVVFQLIYGSYSRQCFLLFIFCYDMNYFPYILVVFADCNILILILLFLFSYSQMALFSKLLEANLRKKSEAQSLSKGQDLFCLMTDVDHLLQQVQAHLYCTIKLLFMLPCFIGESDCFVRLYNSA